MSCLLPEYNYFPGGWEHAGLKKELGMNTCLFCFQHSESFHLIRPASGFPRITLGLCAYALCYTFVVCTRRKQEDPLGRSMLLRCFIVNNLSTSPSCWSLIVDILKSSGPHYGETSFLSYAVRANVYLALHELQRFLIYVITFDTH